VGLSVLGGLLNKKKAACFGISMHVVQRCRQTVSQYPATGFVKAERLVSGHKLDD
jgi:hypothetical protein